MPGQTFISDVAGPNNTRIRNYTGNITDVFSCIAGTGDTGCGFETPLASVARALGADGQGPPPDTNTGFLRPGAFLAVVYITNEDDGSVPPDSRLYAVDDPGLSPLDNFRPQEYGTLCDGAPPPLDVAMSWPDGACQPNPSGGLTPVQTLVDQLVALKPDRSRLLVAAIAGPPNPYGTHLEPVAKGSSVQSAFVNHSCLAADGSYGDPSIRLFSFINALGGIFESICADSFRPPLEMIGNAIAGRLGPACVQGPFVDNDPSTPGIQYDCSVVDEQFQDDGTEVDTVVPACDAPHQGKCWTLVADAACPGPNQLVLQFTPMPDPSTSNLNAAVSCAVCIPGVADPRCL
jgi:hypothetical protein